MQERKTKRRRVSLRDSLPYAIDGADRLSALPDDLLHAILSLLPLRNVLRTAALSRRWRRVWRSAPIDLDATLPHLGPMPAAAFPLRGDACQPLVDYFHWLIRTVDLLLSRHRGPVRAFRLCAPALPVPLNRWLAALAAPRRRLHQLSLTSFRLTTLPPALPSCSMLRALEFRSCTLPKSLPSFAALTDLTLRDTTVSDDVLAELVSSCALLERLCLDSSPLLPEDYCGRDMRVVVRARMLRTLEMCDLPCPVKDILVDESPNLDCLILNEWTTTGPRITVRHTMKLEVLGFVNADIHRLELGEICFEKGRPFGVVTPLHRLKKLAVAVNFNRYDEIDTVSNMLRCFPCLETLDIMVQVDHLYDESVGEKDYPWDQQGLYDCIDLHLKSMTLKGFVGSRQELAFTKFLVARAQVLKEVILIYLQALPSRWAELREPSLEDPASLDLQIDLGGEYDASYLSTRSLEETELGEQCLEKPALPDLQVDLKEEDDSGVASTSCVEALCLENPSSAGLQVDGDASASLEEATTHDLCIEIPSLSGRHVDFKEEDDARDASTSCEEATRRKLCLEKPGSSSLQVDFKEGDDAGETSARMKETTRHEFCLENTAPDGLQIYFKKEGDSVDESISWDEDTRRELCLGNPGLGNPASRGCQIDFKLGNDACDAPTDWKEAIMCELCLDYASSPDLRVNFKEEDDVGDAFSIWESFKEHAY